ncbi:MAG: site-2 protease family protein [Planctomycetes bacterium]|nr:site-2 protease family protein [Planctomycetota bacterium]
MNGSIKIGSILGITLRLHILLLVLFGVLIVGGQDPLIYAILFGCVLLHELGHSLVALAFGIRVVDITLWPLGGMARMSRIPESTLIEGLIALAGPAVNFLLAGLGHLAGGVWGGPFAFVNLLMGLFNLLPAFPMDGGRLLRALLGSNGRWLLATERAVRIGRWFAVLLCVAGVTGFGPWLAPNLALPLVGIFVWYSGSQELAAVRARHADRPSSPVSPTAGFSDEEIEALERFRGRIRDSRSDER